MNLDWQTLVALAIVATAVVLLARAAWRRRGGQGGCGCEAAQVRGKLARKR